MEIDEIWEVELFGNYSYWVTKETYEAIKKLLLTKEISKADYGITFKTISGMEFVLLLSNISNLSCSTRKQREDGRARNKIYREAEVKPNEKKDWE